PRFVPGPRYGLAFKARGIKPLTKIEIYSSSLHIYAVNNRRQILFKGSMIKSQILIAPSRRQRRAVSQPSHFLIAQVERAGRQCSLHLALNLFGNLDGHVALDNGLTAEPRMQGDAIGHVDAVFFVLVHLREVLFALLDDDV